MNDMQGKNATSPPMSSLTVRGDLLSLVLSLAAFRTKQPTLYRHACPGTAIELELQAYIFLTSGFSSIPNPFDRSGGDPRCLISINLTKFNNVARAAQAHLDLQRWSA
jgi:hypothetical protein